MRERLSMLVILIFSVIPSHARPSVTKNSLFITGKDSKVTFGDAKATPLNRRVAEGDVREPARRSVRRTYSRRRVNRRWKRYSIKMHPKVNHMVKLQVPVNIHSVTGVAMTGNIEKGKGHLPWPVSSGTVSMRFGLYEVLKGINHNSIGITIETAPGIPVTSVFGGYVQSVFTVDDKPVVMIRHGKYFTTYSNLTAVAVSKDEPVSTGQILGTVSENGQLDFIISDTRDNHFDPEKWLTKHYD